MQSRAKFVLVIIGVSSLILVASFSPLLTSESYSFDYTVKAGDTLSHIGSKYNVNWRLIASANGMSSPYLLYVGEQLTIPLQSTSISYTVQPGDYLSAIGNYYEVPWQSIASASEIAPPYTIYVGEILVIPLVTTLVQTTSSPATSQISKMQLAMPSQTDTVFLNSTDYITSTLTTYVTSIQVLTSTVTATSIATTTTFSSSTRTSTSWVWSTVTNVVTTIVTSMSTVFQTDATTSTAVIQSTATVTSTQTAFSTAYTTVTAVVTLTSTSTSTSTTSLASTTSTSNADPISTGNSLYDSYDSIILAAASQYNLDPMVLKSQMAQESFFNPRAVSPDDPCGQILQNGVDVGHSYGLMQMTPACISWFAKNPDGSVDLSTDSTSFQWANSAFNPTYNVNSAASDWAAQLQSEEQSFPGCTQTQYVKMVLSAYNAGPGSVASCTTYNAQGTTYINAILNWYTQFSAMSGWPNPY